ncbi:MAG TPA: DUF58 domain-containing protein [Pyrinomonadaceae bacterium]|jgi:uncharacterized protein (DUF58 family)|nr:DUF58 domain-containing protein [Pyrinomonadaceae bacterium]
MKDEEGARRQSNTAAENKSPRLRVAASPRLRKWRNAILSLFLVLLGLGTTLVVLVARRDGDWQLANIAAIASLVIVLLIIILVVPPLVRSARAEVSHFDFPAQITKGGVIFLGVLAVVAFAAWNTGNNLLFLVFSVLASTLFVAWVAARVSLRDLVVSARFPDHIYAGEAAPVIVTLRNTKRFFPSFSVLVEARGPLDKKEKKEGKRRRRRTRVRYAKRTLAYYMYVPHRAAAEQRVEQLFEKRGHELITGFELSTRFPFGFFRRRRRLRARDVDIIVYPKPEPLGDELHLLPMNAGRLISTWRGAGHDLLSLRDYQPQDDLRHIDWKATARARRLIVRQFAAEDERRVTIALDTSARDGVDEKELSERFERGVTLAASLVAHFIDERAEVRLVIGEEKGRYGIGLEHLHNCLKRLALSAPDGKPADSELETAWSEVDSSSTVGNGNYVILLTTAAPGSIPANVWRTSHVLYL